MPEAGTERTTLHCPTCGRDSEEVMPQDACLFFWTCPHCDTRHQPAKGDCCVFCSFGSRPCPSVENGLPPACRDPAVVKALERIPGVGRRVSADLWDLGIREISDLRQEDPEELYARLCRLQGKQVDRCMLYTLRCAVYFASTSEPDPELLKWWNWKEPGPVPVNTG